MWHCFRFYSSVFSLIVVCLLVLSSIVHASTFSYPNLCENRFEDEEYQYHNYSTMTSVLHSLYENHSDICHMQSLGTSYEGRSIWLIKISDNPVEGESEPAVLLMGAHHGNEKPSYESLIFFIEFVLKSYGLEDIDTDNDGLIDEDGFDGIDDDGDGLIDEDPSEQWITELVDSTEMYILPMVNPDGVEYNWRKNHAPNYGSFGTADEITSYGVDLNRNYGYKWYLPYLLPWNYMLPFIINDRSWNYRGECPFSEAETQVVRDLVLSHKNIKISLSYHSYSEVIMYPWTHTSLDTPDEELFVSIGENMSDIDGYELLTHGWSGREYLIPRFSGTIGTSENWLYGERGIISFTMELCKERVPLDPIDVFEYCWKHVGVNLYVAQRSLSFE